MNGLSPVLRVLATAIRAGIREDKLVNAKERLSVKEWKGTGGRWWWQLPDASDGDTWLSANGGG